MRSKDVFNASAVELDDDEEDDGEDGEDGEVADTGARIRRLGLPWAWAARAWRAGLLLASRPAKRAPAPALLLTPRVAIAIIARMAPLPCEAQTTASHSPPGDLRHGNVCENWKVQSDLEAARAEKTWPCAVCLKIFRRHCAGKGCERDARSRLVSAQLSSMGATGATTVRDHVEWCWERRYRLDEILAELWSNVRPGGRLHPDWFFEAKGHVAVEFLLFAVIIFLLTRKSFKPKKEKPLSKKEQDELIEEWAPEPLVPRVRHASTAQISSDQHARTHAATRARGRRVEPLREAQGPHSRPPAPPASFPHLRPRSHADRRSFLLLSCRSLARSLSWTRLWVCSRARASA